MRILDIVRSLMIILLLTFFAASDAFSAGVPITFKGSLGFDTVRLHDYRRTGPDTAGPVINSGSQAIPGNEDKAFLQTYIFRLNPELVVNDHVTVKAEFSSGYGRGGNLGDNSTVNQNQSTAGFGGRFYSVSPAHNKSLDVNQLYMDIYADIATFKVGRYNKHWGLGAVFNSGEKAGDRFFTLYEGVEATFGLGKFYITPHWANLNSGTGNLTHEQEVKDLGLSALYDNPDKDLKLGIYYGYRKTGAQNTLYVDPSGNSIGKSSVTIFDIFYHKYWDKFSLGIEVPFISGEIGNVYDPTINSEYKAAAYIVEAAYELTESWKLKFNGGYADGDGSSNTFEAMYLHPNYQVAEIMFRYNLNAVENANFNLYDSAISNALYAKLGAEYLSGLWTWRFDMIWAKANETASAGATRAWQHELGYEFTPTANQEDDLGTEFDVSFDYQWNPNLTLTGFLAYYMIGDYYAFTNTGTDLELEDQLAAGMRLYLSF